MSQILVRDLEPATVERLKVIAARSQRSVQALVKQLLDDLAAQDLYRDEFMRLADEIRERSGPQTTSGVDLIREDRDNR
jgi:plasmid stability protein